MKSSSTDLMGGYTAYTTPNVALNDLATTGAVAEQQQSFSLSLITISLISPVTITIIEQ